MDFVRPQRRQSLSRIAFPSHAAAGFVVWQREILMAVGGDVSLRILNGRRCLRSQLRAAGRRRSAEAQVGHAMLSHRQRMVGRTTLEIESLGSAGGLATNVSRRANATVRPRGEFNGCGTAGYVNSVEFAAHGIAQGPQQLSAALALRSRKRAPACPLRSAFSAFSEWSRPASGRQRGRGGGRCPAGNRRRRP